MDSAGALAELATSLELDTILKDNLKQLCGWANVGNGKGDRNDRDARHKVRSPHHRTHRARTHNSTCVHLPDFVPPSQLPCATLTTDHAHTRRRTYALAAHTYLRSMRRGATLSMGAQASNWQLLSGVKWLRHEDTNELLPLVGQLKFMFEEFIVPRSDVPINSMGSLRNLISGHKKRIGKWLHIDKLYTPTSAQALPNGSSLLGLSYETASAQFVAEVRTAWGLQVSADLNLACHAIWTHLFGVWNAAATTACVETPHSHCSLADCTPSILCRLVSQIP